MPSPDTTRRRSNTTRSTSSGGSDEVVGDGSALTSNVSSRSSKLIEHHHDHHHQSSASRQSSILGENGDGYMTRLYNMVLGMWRSFLVLYVEPFLHALRAASATILKMMFIAVLTGVVMSCIVAIASVSGFTFAASVRWLVLRGAPEDATIPLEFDSNFRVSEGLGREWLGRLSESVQQTIDAAVDEMPTSTPLSRRALRLKAETDDKDDPHHLHHHPSDTASLLQALLRGDSDGNDGNALVLEALSGEGGDVGARIGGSRSSSYKHQKENGGIDRMGGDLGIADLMESSRSSSQGRQRSHDGSAPPVLGTNTKRHRSKKKQEELGFLDRLWENALAPGSSRNFPFVEDTLPLDDELMRDSDTDYASWGSTWIDDSYGLPPPSRTAVDATTADGEESPGASPPLSSSGLPPNTCPLNPDATCESCHRKVDRQSERSRELALELLHAKEKQTKLKLSVAARLVETAIKEGKSQHVVEAWSHVSGLVSELIRLRTKAESAVESSMVAKTTLQLTDLTTRGGAFSFLRKTSPRDSAPLSLHQPRYTLRSGTSYDIKVTLSARIHYRPEIDDPSISPSGLLDADCKLGISDRGFTGGRDDVGVLGWLWGWVGGERLWTVPHESGGGASSGTNPHDRCGASVLSYRDTQLVLQSGLVTSDRKVLAESSEKTPIRSLPLFLEGSISSLIHSGVLPSSLNGSDESDAGGLLYRCTFGVLWAVWDWCVWCALLPIRTFMFFAGTAFQAACEAVLWFAFGWLRIGLMMADRVARFVLGVPQVAPSLLHHYLHMVPPHTLTAAATTLLGNNNVGGGSLTTSHQGITPTTTPTIPLVGYAQNLVFSVASGFVPSSDLISKLASLELLVMKEVDSSAASASGGTYPSKVSVMNAHVSFHASLQGVQYYFSEYPVTSFLVFAGIWGGFIGCGCLAAVGGVVALYYNSTTGDDGAIRPTHTKRVYPEDDHRPHTHPSQGNGGGSQYASSSSTGYAAVRRNQPPSRPTPPSPPSSSSYTTNDEEDSYTGESEADTVDYNGRTTPATTTNNSTPARGSAVDLSGMSGSNRVWTPRPVRSRGGSRREQQQEADRGAGVTSPNNQEARWGDVTSHRLGSEEGWARRSEDPVRDEAAASSRPRPAATGNFGGGSHQTRVTSPYSR